jgi:hypothetical protein
LDSVPAPREERRSTSTTEAPASAPSDSIATQRLELVLAELRKLRESVRAWPPQSLQRNFASIDMSALRRTVVEFGVAPSELQALLERSDLDDADRSLLLASYAYTPPPNEAERAFVLACLQAEARTHVYRPGSMTEPQHSAVVYAGVFALGMRGASCELTTLALELTERFAQPENLLVDHESLKWLLGFTLTNIHETSPEATAMLLRVTEFPQNEHFSGAAWRALAQSDGVRWSDVILESGKQNGRARRSIEHMRDPTLVPTLERRALDYRRPSGSKGSFDYYVSSIFGGLLAIDSAESAEAFERLFFSDAPVLAYSAWGSIDELFGTSAAPATGGAAVLIQTELNARRSGRHERYGPQLTHPIEYLRERAARATFTDDERKRSSASLVRILPNVADDPTALTRTLRMLALVDDDRAAVDRYTAALAPEVREQIEKDWTHAHPRPLEASLAAKAK